MKQQSEITLGMTEAQERAAATARSQTHVFRVYTAGIPSPGGMTLEDLRLLITRYFDNATIHDALGIYQSKFEESKIIEIVGTLDDLQKAVDLAGDIRMRGAQAHVLVTWTPTSRVDVYDARVNNDHEQDGA